MKNPHWKIRVLIIICISFIFSTVIAVSSNAENYPNIDNIERSLYFVDDYKFFHRPNKGYVLLSTDKTNQSMAALLNENGDFDYSSTYKTTSINFVYKNTFLLKNYLYIIGKLPEQSKGVAVGRLNLSNGRFIVNRIINVECDFSKKFICDNNGKLSIYTAPLGQSIDDISVPNTYIFDDKHINICLSPQPSEIDSNPSEDNSDEQSGNSSDSVKDSNNKDKEQDKINEPETKVDDKTPLSNENYYFDSPVTIDYLQAILEENGLGQKLRVISANNQEVKKGYVGTGMTIETHKDEKIETVYTAIVAGDLDGLGTVTNNDYRILYDYLTQSSSDKLAILNGPFYEAAKITDDLKADKSDRKLHTSDLLKIKKLIK